MRIATIFFAVCVAGWATCALAGDVVRPSLEGRWTGHFGGSSVRPESCTNAGECKLTLDIVACGKDWCGTRIDDKGGCAGTALKLSLAANQPDNHNFANYKGKLELVKGSSPYYLDAWSRRSDANATPELHMVGDTGGEIRFLRRTFPFSANLTRTDKAHCQADAKTS